MMRKLPVGVIGLALAAIFGYHYVYKLEQEQVRLIQKQIAEEQTKQETQQAVAGLVQRLEAYRTRLAQQPDPSGLVREVVALGKKTDVQFTGINQEAPQQLGQFTRLGVALQFTASYHQLGTFLDYLEHASFLIRTEQMDVDRAGDSEQASIRLVVSTLYLPPPL